MAVFLNLFFMTATLGSLFKYLCLIIPQVSHTVCSLTGNLLHLSCFHHGYSLFLSPLISFCVFDPGVAVEIK